MLHMYTSNAFMSEVSRLSSDADTEKGQLAELATYAEGLPEVVDRPTGGRWWAIDLRGENFKFAMRDESVQKHDRGDTLYRHLEECGAAMIAHKRRKEPPRNAKPF